MLILHTKSGGLEETLLQQRGKQCDPLFMFPLSPKKGYDSLCLITGMTYPAV